MSNLAWGLQMTVLGMGLVFGVLALLYALLHFVLRLDGPPIAPVAPAGSHAPTSDLEDAQDAAAAKRAQGIDMDVLAAITVAVVAHMTQQRRTAAPTKRTFWPGSQLHASRWVASGRMRQNQSWQRKGR